MATVPRPETIRTSSTCADERAARSAASGVPTRQRLRRQAEVMRQLPGFRMQSGPSRSSREYAKVVNLLHIFDGDMPVLLYLMDTKQYLQVPRHLYTSGHPLLFEELERLVGTDNIATK